MNNFAPRVGVAWDVNGDGRTVARVGWGIYYNHISGTSVHAAEAPWTGTVQLFNGRLDDPFGSLNRTVPPAGVPISGEFGCVQIQRLSGIELPAVSAATQLRLQRPGDGDADGSARQRLAPASAHERLHGRRGVRGAVRHQTGGTPALQSCPVHQLSTDRGGSRDWKRGRARRVRTGDHRSDVPRARDALRELV